MLVKMFIYRIVILIFITSRSLSLELSSSKNSNNYGPYYIKWYNYKLCRGPRPKNVTLSSSTFVIDKYGAVANYNSTFVMTAKIEEIKVTVWNVNGNQKNTLWNYKLNKPCQHFALSEMLVQYYHNMRNCVVQPGEYLFKCNYTEVAYKFFGSSFFYGDYAFKINILAKQGNLICITINALFSKIV